MKTKNHFVPVSQNREPGNAKSQYRGKHFSVSENEKVATQHMARPKPTEKYEG